MKNRSFHFIPAHKIAFFDKINFLNADHIIFDLEDGVPENEIELARKNILNYSTEDSDSSFWIRIHELGSKFYQDDLNLIKNLKNIGIVIPKFRPSSILEFPQYLKKIVLIESLEDLTDLSFEKANLQKANLFGIGLGLEDMLTDFFQKNEDLEGLIKHIKSQFVINSKSFVQILISGVFTDYKNTLGLKKESLENYGLGFDGCFSIHPSQIEIINKIFDISKENLEQAKKIMTLPKDNKNPGYSIIDGVLITPPKLAKAKTIIKRGENNE